MAMVAMMTMKISWLQLPVLYMLVYLSTATPLAAKPELADKTAVRSSLLDYKYQKNFTSA